MNGFAPRLAAYDDAAVYRLRRFEQEHPAPAVRVFPPKTPRSRWRAEIKAGTVPGDPREMIVTEWDLGVFVGKLEELFAPP